MQDIDQMCLFKPLCKFTATITRVEEIIPTLQKALQVAQSGTPGTLIQQKYDLDTACLLKYIYKIFTKMFVKMSMKDI